MGWYEAVGRRLFFSLDPERSHRLAHRLLGLPLPWRTIGGAVDDPALRTSLAGIALRNPIGLAAGFDKTCAHLDALGSLGVGYVVGGAARARPGKPLFVKTPPFPAGGDGRTQAVSIATAARDAGASGIVCANPVPVADPRMSTGRGGLSGGPLTADTPRMVAEIVDAI